MLGSEWFRFRWRGEQWSLCWQVRRSEHPRMGGLSSLLQRIPRMWLFAASKFYQWATIITFNSDEWICLYRSILYCTFGIKSAISLWTLSRCRASPTTQRPAFSTWILWRTLSSNCLRLWLRVKMRKICCWHLSKTYCLMWVREVYWPCLDIEKRLVVKIYVGLPCMNLKKALTARIPSSQRSKNSLGRTRLRSWQLVPVPSLNTATGVVKVSGASSAEQK